ncbi:polysaccharide deacetylase family protein [Streptococcus fryi]
MQSRTSKYSKKHLRPLIIILVLLLPVLSYFVYKPIKQILKPEQTITKSVMKKTSQKETPPTVSTNIDDNNTDWQPQDTPVKIPILMYHAIHHMGPEEAPNANLIVAPEVFESHIKGLKEAGYYFLTPDEAYRALTENSLPSDKVVWLTFDDSLWDFYQIAYPIMKQYEVKATNNVITGFTENAQIGHLTLEQIKEMKSNGMSFESHTVTHPDLSQTDVQSQYYQLEQSKQYLDNQLDQISIAITYPSGRYNDSTLTISEQFYKLGLTTNEGIASRSDGLLTLKRVRILPTTDVESLISYIEHN